MICLNCGKAIDDDLKVCPFCGSLTEVYDPAPAYEGEAAEEAPAAAASGAPEAEASDGQDFFDENPEYPEPRNTGERKLKLPATGSLLALILSALACVLCLACLLAVNSLRASLRDQNTVLTGSVSEVRNAVNAVNERLDQMDSTLARVQSEAYNQFASQSIAITKDVTPLTGPVEAGKYNIMFIVNAKGNLSVNSSFDWQKYNAGKGAWESIAFTGSATTNEEYGLRLENNFDKKENTYTSILWANGITSAASGNYRCVITDETGITKPSSEAKVTVS